MPATEQAIARTLIQLLDLTDLNEMAKASDIVAMTHKAVTPHGPVAALCVWPAWISEVRKHLRGEDVAIATVINFPKGGEDIERAVEDAQEALRDGAHEIDLVLPWQALKEGRIHDAAQMVEGVRQVVPDDCLLKVILETGMLGDDKLIRKAAQVAIIEGADFIKTSTGKNGPGASLGAARIMLEEIAAVDGNCGFKASGGVRTYSEAASYLALAEELLGEDWICPSTFRIGASGLLDELLIKAQ